MSVTNSFWINSAPQWENQRYQGFFSKFLFSSLRFRRQYLLFILNQLPEGTRVLELGCGSGLLFGELNSPSRLIYTGVDISPAAIAQAKESFSGYANAGWECASIAEIKGRQFDYVISAGLLDWISDSDIREFLRDNQTRYHVHSFSENTEGAKTFAHRIFSTLVSKKSGIKYDPRKFRIAQIEANFSNIGDLQIVRNKKLSFGAFVHNLPPTVNSSFEDMLVAGYFSEKNAGSPVEAFFKRLEFKAVKSAVSVAGKTVLEAGSGQGQYSRWILHEKPAGFVCVDAFVSTPRYAPETAAYFQRLPLQKIRTGPYDVVFALGVLEFVSDKEAFLQHLLALTAPGGSLLLLVPREKGFVSRIYKWLHRRRGIVIPPDLDLFLTRSLAQHPRKASFTKLSGGPLNFLFIIKIDEKNIVRS